MRYLLTLQIALSLSIGGIMIAAPSVELTNHVALGEGIFLSFADEHGERLDAARKTLDVEKPTNLRLQNTGNKRAYSIFLRKRLQLNLRSEDGVEVPKTGIGKAVSRAPKSITDLDANFTVTGQGHPGILLRPGEERTVEFGVLDKLFTFPHDGHFVLEARFWAWNNQQNRFALSSPLRIRVHKGQRASR